MTKRLQCPVCGGKLREDEAAFQCKNCRVQYPVIEGIPNFYPSENIFSPRKFNLKNKYEHYGEEKSRPNSFQNVRRKKLTIDMVGGEHLLEIGSAEGWMTEELTWRVRKVVSCDIAHSYLKRAKEQGINAHFVQLDAHYLPFTDASFDCVVLTEVLEHVYSPYRVLEEIHRVLIPGGTLILSVPNNLTFSNILQHLIHKNVQNKDAHISFYDVFSIQKLLNFVGFSARESRSVVIYLPLTKSLFYSDRIQNILQILFKHFGDKVIIKSVKMQDSLWEKL